MPKGPRQPHEPKIIGSGTAAGILGVNQTNLRTQSGLPEPYDKDKRIGTLWREDEIRALARRKSRAKTSA